MTALDLRRMTQAAYDRWRSTAVELFAQSFVDSGILDLEAALKRAEVQFAQLLPDGLDTPGHSLLSAFDGDTEVGMTWLFAGEPDASTMFVYDFQVDETMRRRGLGRRLMEAVVADARARGMAAIALHVFGHNTGARALYEQAGFEVTSVNMKLTL